MCQRRRKFHDKKKSEYVSEVFEFCRIMENPNASGEIIEPTKHTYIWKEGNESFTTRRNVNPSATGTSHLPKNRKSKCL